MKRIFRLIVIAAFLLQIVLFYLPYTWVYVYEGDALNLLSWSGYGASIDPNGPVPYFILAAYGAASAGLVLFQRWARPAFIVLTAANLISSPLWGMVVTTPLAAPLGYLVAMADGAIIVLCYLTSLSEAFGVSAQQSASADAAKLRG